MLKELRGEAQALEEQLDRSRDQMGRAEAELDRLQEALDGLDPSDPRHVSTTPPGFKVPTGP